MTTTITATTRVGAGQVLTNVGPWDEDRGDLRFGWDAELRVTDGRYGDEHVLVEISFGAIGSLPADQAAERARSYATAAALGVTLQNLIDGEGFTFDQIADYLSNPDALLTDGISLEFVWDPRAAGEERT